MAKKEKRKLTCTSFIKLTSGEVLKYADYPKEFWEDISVEINDRGMRSVNYVPEDELHPTP